MDSLVDQAAHSVGTELKRVRWSLGISGAVSVAFGVIILVWPGISLLALTILFGVMALCNGVFSLAMVIGGTVKEARGWLIASGVLGIAVGVIVLVWPDISELALLYVIGAYAVALGIITVGGAFWLPLLDGGDRALLVLTGIVSIVFGIVMFAKPGDGALVLLALIAAFALVSGISELVVAIGWKRLFERELKRSFARSRPQAAPVS
jgi:uncharacterized membrane protein HdeD (DUF308 family)